MTGRYARHRDQHEEECRTTSERGRRRVHRAAVEDPVVSEGGHRDKAGDERSNQWTGVKILGGAAEGRGQRVARLGSEGEARRERKAAIGERTKRGGRNAGLDKGLRGAR